MRTRFLGQSRMGFTLMEMIVVVLLLGVFLMVFSQLFVVTFRAKTEAEKRDALLHRIDSAVASMRRDVWGASGMNADGAEVDLLLPDGAPVSWRSASDGTLTRSGKGGAVQSWKQMPAVTFTSAGALLTLHVHAVERDESLTLVSEGMLEGGGR